jgi:hypothetical protein
LDKDYLILFRADGLGEVRADFLAVLWRAIVDAHGIRQPVGTCFR